ncbi:DUF922 domain-containing protein [Winogradskyella sp. DF17]|uniref:DUF922 domain-containing protein n=1 Tax=Winogradskyella pelagia TaxID=2819984 RepID=A0ABS3T1W2_9FLAO|nr:DUF922 domain-containing protein [Winogradskyella sp. DF17]MBO3116733.1 DUF922 domain-containing protein [Winogradskyella sp. DF17]
MHLNFFGIILFLLLVFSQPKANDEALSWKDNRPLTWADFKARPQSNSSALAQTSSGISFGYSLKTRDGRIVDYNTNVQAHFYPNKSWYLKDKADGYILKHEQLHFDITELYARHFRKRLKSIRVNQNLRQQLANLQNDINKAVNKTQKRYDAETNHSINREAQKIWQSTIAKELERLQEFSSK